MADTEYTREQHQAVAVPLIEQLRSVPRDAVLRIDAPNALNCMDTRSIPVGRLCHEAAAALPSASLGEQHTYNCEDEDLRELLNHVAYMQFTADAGGSLNHDDGMGFLMALERVQERLQLAASPASKGAGRGGEAPEARRERLIANGYKTDSRCTWLAIGRCAECGRVHDGRPLGTSPDQQEQSRGGEG